MKALAAVLLFAAMPAAFACTVPPTLVKDLKRADVVAIGSLRVIQESEERNGANVTYKGVAELVPTKVVRNRTSLKPPFRIEYEQIVDDAMGCFFGHRVAANSDAEVKAYLKRSKNGKALWIVAFESTGKASD